MGTLAFNLRKHYSMWFVPGMPSFTCELAASRNRQAPLQSNLQILKGAQLSRLSNPEGPRTHCFRSPVPNTINPEGPSTTYLRSLAPKIIEDVVFGNHKPHH